MWNRFHGISRRSSFPVNSDHGTGRQHGKITSKSVVVSAGVTALWLAMASCELGWPWHAGYAGYPAMPARKGWNCQREQKQQSFCWSRIKWVNVQKTIENPCHIQTLQIRQMTEAIPSYLKDLMQLSTLSG